MNPDDPTEPMSHPPPPSDGLGGMDPGELLARAIQTAQPSGGVSAWKPPAPEELARLLPQYHIESLLGHGGMGAVYKGRQAALDRAVAIKILPAEMAADEQFVERFQREARTLAKLQHPGIVTVHDFGQTSEGHLYFVMEYVEGTDLQRILRAPGGLNLAQALSLISQICDALHYAHGAGVIHRDIKPANILVKQDGRAKVADFGLARPVTEETATLTSINVIMGTEAYMAPEQRTGHAVDERADIYALGVMLYEMLTGQRPHGVFDPPSRKVQIDVRLDEVVLKALQEEPERRYQHASEMKTDVDRIRTTPVENTAGATRKAERKSSRIRVATVIAACLLAAGAIGFGIWKKVQPSRVASAQAGAGNAAGESSPALQRVEAQNTLASADGLKPSTTSPAAATKDLPFVNSLGMRLVPVPITGGPTDGQRVLFSVWETRVQDYEIFATETKRETVKPDFAQGPTHPVVMVNWEDATAFCAWLTDRERNAGTLSAHEAYRLPSDHEWSCAIGIGDRENPTELSSKKNGANADAFPWGSSWPPPPGLDNYSGEEGTEYPSRGRVILPGYRDDFVFTAPVGSYAASPSGLFDLGGNVREFCDDWVDAAHKRPTVRGSAFPFGKRADVLASCRYWPQPTLSYNALGFRVVLGGSVSTSEIPPHTTSAAPLKKKASTSSSTPGATGAASAASLDKAEPPASTPKPQSEIEKWLAQVDAIYQPIYQRDVKAPFETGMAALRKNYLAALDREIANASKAAKLKDALAFRNERQRMEAHQGVPADDSDAPPTALKPMRAEYRQHATKLDTDRRKRTAPVFEQYDKVLLTNQNTLTQQQRLDDAALLQHRRDTLAEAWLGSARTKPNPSASNSNLTALATKEQPFVNSLGMKFVPVPITGGPTDGQRVLFSVWETRVRDYKRFAELSNDPATEAATVTTLESDSTRGWSWKRAGGSWRDPHFPQTDDHPVVGTNWDDARAFCRWLTEYERRNGQIPADWQYRLPTDHEWSCAAGLGQRENPAATPESKSGKAILLPWGDAWPPPAKAGNYADISSRTGITAIPQWQSIEGYEDGYPRTAPVGSFPADSFGLHDLSGNVWEWCESVFRPGEIWRTGRGGCWEIHDKAGMQLSLRFGGQHHMRTVIFGFRVVLAPAPSALPATAVPPAALGPKRIGTDNDWKAIAAGERHALAIKADGSLWAWGENSFGQLGTGTKEFHPGPVKIGSGKDWTQVVARQYQSNALKANGTLWSWGQNIQGQLGNGTKSDCTSPRQIGIGKRWTAIATGFDFSVAIREDRTLWAWGVNSRGQLGDGTRSPSLNPKQIGTDNNWVAVRAGFSHAVALKSDGTVWGWGINECAQLSARLPRTVMVPTRIADFGDCIAIEARNVQTFALRRDGSLWGCGMNNVGQIGVPVIANLLDWSRIGEDANWKFVVAANEETFAVKTDGSLWAWGKNERGQLGDGTTTNRSRPVRVGADNDWDALAAVPHGAFLLKRDGSLWTTHDEF